MRKGNLPVPLSIVIIAAGICAAPVITPDDAVKMALDNNYGVRIAANKAEIARIASSAGNAGMLPAASLSGSDVVSITRPPAGDGSPDAYRKTTNTITLNPSIDWTVFDGWKMFVTRKKLAQIAASGEVEFKEKVVQTAAQVIAAYYDIVQQRQQIAFTEEVMGYDSAQMSIAQAGFTAGLLSRQAVLQAALDLNENMQKSISSRNALVAMKRELNRLLRRSPDTEFDVVDTITTDSLPDKKQLFSMVDSCNTTIEYLQRQVAIAELTLKEAGTVLYPRVTIGAGYNFKLSNTTGSGDYHNYGPQFGAGISMPLYQAGAVTRAVKTSKLNVESTRLQLENAREQVRSQLLDVIDSYHTQIKLQEIENENVLLAKENLDISLQRYKLGQSSYLEYSQARQSYESAKTRLINIRYSMKIAHTQVRLLLAKL